ncbi:MAG: ABC transporter permease [Candidatus Cloacimonetes bacterium]|nr:ABC transporter permease [Candidatus Cloacimonadota bacterium]
MRTILIILKKEFRQIFRSRPMLLVILAMPVIQLLILSNAADYEIKQLRLAIEDFDKSRLSAELIEDFTFNEWFELTALDLNQEKNDELLAKDEVEAIIAIEAGFEKNLQQDRTGNIQIRLNAIDGATAEVAASYIAGVINKWAVQEQKQVRSRYLYNPELNYKSYMVPGILVMLVSVIGIILTALNIVREKEIGTQEQINVTPIRKYEYILGKLIPMLIIGIVEFSLGLILAIVVFGVPHLGNILLLYVYLFFYLVVMCGIGLFISTVAGNQQQALFLAFFMMMIFLFLSGLFAPIESMPDWAKVMTKFVPLSYFIRVMRSIMLKGSGFLELQMELVVLIVMGIIMQTIAVLNYRKR